MRRFSFRRLLSCGSLALLLPVFAGHTSSCGSKTASSTTSPPSTAAAATTYYVNCGAGHDANSGTSASAPWGSLDKVNSTTFQPGDSILFARGAVCNGQLKPKGSGSSSAVITLGDYGAGALPVISAGSIQSALTLFDQSYWEIKNLETTGGDPYGIWVTGNTANAVIHHIYLSNVAVHDVTGTPTQKESGLIVFNTTGTGESFDDVLVDGASAYSTSQWAGIYIDGATWSSPAGIKGANITVRNCTVHDVGGDGIVIHITTNALIEKCTAYNTGQTTVTSIGTPSAIWNWDCNTCTVQFNEAYLSHTPTNNDGGDYDSDYYNNNITIQYNYGHDADGYCVSVFGASGQDTNVNTTIRYNVCANNGRHPNKAGQGDFFYSTWDGGTIVNSQVYNNTSYWNPANSTVYALNVRSAFDSSKPNYFVNNIIFATVPGMENYSATSGKGLTSDYNIYWYTGSGSPQWQANAVNYGSLGDWQGAMGMDSHSLFTDPLLNSPTYHDVGRPTTAFTLATRSPAANAGWNMGNMGSQDFFGNALPKSGAVDIGACQAPTSFSLLAARGGRCDLTDLLARKRVVLLSFIDARSQPLSRTYSDPSRGQLVFLKSMAQQYGPNGVEVLIVGCTRPFGGQPLAPSTLLNFSYDWQLNGVTVLRDDDKGTAFLYGVSRLPTTLLIASDGRIQRRWDGFVAPAQLAFALESLVGPPRFRR